MTNYSFFDIKAREAGFDDNEYDCKIVSNLYTLVNNVFHGEDLEDLYSEYIQYGDCEQDFETELYSYSDKEECYILHGLDCEDSFRVLYLLNQFGIELVYRNANYRVYIKK